MQVAERYSEIGKLFMKKGGHQAWCPPSFMRSDLSFLEPGLQAPLQDRSSHQLQGDGRIGPVGLLFEFIAHSTDKEITTTAALNVIVTSAANQNIVAAALCGCRNSELDRRTFR
jgi:hypothetical protein